jgi:hypothetical protein
VPPTNQAQVKTAIDSYNQQMKDFKQSINEMDARVTGRVGGPNLGLSQYTVQEEEEGMPGRFGMTNADNTFRTEMMTGPRGSIGPGNQGFSNPAGVAMSNQRLPPSIIVS